MGKTWLISLAAVGGLVGTMLFLRPTPADALRPAEPVPLPTGRVITPVGEHVEVGSWPCNLETSPDGRFVVSTNIGTRQFLSVLDAATGKLVSQTPFNGEVAERKKEESLYFGLDFGRDGSGRTLLAVGTGALDQVLIYELSPEGKLALVKTLDNTNPAPLDKLENDTAGVAFNADASVVYAACNTGYAQEDLQGAVAAIDVASGKRLWRKNVPGFPLEVLALHELGVTTKLYVACERDALAVLDPATGETTKRLSTGANPTHLLLSADTRTLYVSNSNSDTVSAVDTAKDSHKETYLARPAAARGLAGATPLGMALGPGEKELYVALADLNAIGVIDLESGEFEGMVPTGWYPTDVALSRTGLLVSCAKGVAPRLPNAIASPRSNSTYILTLYEGTVSRLPLPGSSALESLSAKAMENSMLARIPQIDAMAETYNPGIAHVIYIIKENRTYDQILGDMPRGNGDPELALFGKDVTPNHHALAERFVLLDNFYVCAEVSADGWNWSTSGMANEYTSRNSTASYTRDGRNYDFEGGNSGTPVDLQGVKDVATAEGGYLWDNAFRHGVSFRNYGSFIAFGAGLQASKRVLEGRTCPDFQRYDMSYADSDLWVKYGVNIPTQLKKFGRYDDPSRLNAWEREYDAYLRSGDMPKLMILRLPRDHTSGTAAGQYTPAAMVADNDYAVGRVVEKVSQGPLWTKTAIFILEDDAQAGIDHVDAHRSIALLVSPFVAKGTYDSTFYNTDSVLRSMELLLGLPPMNQLDAVATPFLFLGKRPTNAAPYQAILPSREIATAINQRTAYRSEDSGRLISRWQEESLPDIELNDILWHSIKGTGTPMPRPRGVLGREEDED